MTPQSTPPIVTVTPNPAIDQTLSIASFAAGRVNRITHSRQHAAGKGVNVAAMLADLGASAVVCGWLGAGNAGVFETLFVTKRIDDQFTRVPGDTRVGIKIIDDTTGQTTDINFPGLRVPPDAPAALLRRVTTRVKPGAWVVLAGSLPPGVEADFYASAIDTVRAAGGRVALDTSGEPLRLALPRSPDLVKPNAAELAELVGRDLPTIADVVAAARELVTARGVKFVAVSMGGDGAVFVTAAESVRTRAPAVTVRSTVGAGDAMVAGLVFALSQGRPLADAARLATALGTYAVTRVGSGLERADAHAAVLARVTIEILV